MPARKLDRSDYEQMDRLRASGLGWPEIAKTLRRDPATLRVVHHRYRRGQIKFVPRKPATAAEPVLKPKPEPKRPVRRRDPYAAEKRRERKRQLREREEQRRQEWRTFLAIQDRYGLRDWAPPEYHRDTPEEREAKMHRMLTDLSEEAFAVVL